MCPMAGGLRCGELELIRVRRRTLADLRTSTDDPQGLSFLEQLGEMVEVDMRRLEYDVYVDVQNGATVAVPAGLTLQPQGGSCIAALYDGGMRLIVEGYRGSAFLAETEFLLGLEDTRLTWQQDMVQLSGSPGWRPDGLVADLTAGSRISATNVSRPGQRGHASTSNPKARRSVHRSRARPRGEEAQHRSARLDSRGADASAGGRGSSAAHAAHPALWGRCPTCELPLPSTRDRRADFVRRIRRSPHHGRACRRIDAHSLFLASVFDAESMERTPSPASTAWT